MNRKKVETELGNASELSSLMFFYSVKKFSLYDKAAIHYGSDFQFAIFTLLFVIKMFDITVWVKIHQSLRIRGISQEKIYKESLGVFENIEYKLTKLKQNLNANDKLNEAEIEVYSRYLGSLTCLLIENWEKIVQCCMEVIIFSLEENLHQENQCLKRIKKSLICCKRVKEEVKIGSQMKGIYAAAKFESALDRIDILQECIFHKYFNKELF